MTHRPSTDPPRPRAARPRTRVSSAPVDPMFGDGELLLFFSPETPSLAALTTLEHLGRPYRVCRVQTDELELEVFRRLNPKGRVPVLWTDDGLLTETTAVLMHLCTLGFRAGALPSPGTRRRDLFYEWLGYLDGTLRPALEPLAYPQRNFGAERDAAEVEGRARLILEEHLRYVDGCLEPGPYLLGEDYSVLDSYLFALVRLSQGLVDLPAVAPRVGLHLDHVRNQPETRFALAVESAERAPTPGAGGGYRGEVALRHLARASEHVRARPEGTRPPSSPVGGVSPTP